MSITRRELLAAIHAFGETLGAAEPSFECIDTHTHMHRSVPAMRAALEKVNWRCLSICDSREIDDQPSILSEMTRGTKILHSESTGRIAWSNTFDPRPFDAPDFAARVIADLQHDFREEVAGTGMGMRSESG